MEKALRYFHRIRSKNPSIDDNIKDILANCKTPQAGLTLAEIRAAYRERTERKFPIRSDPIGMTEFLLTIPYIAAYCNHNGTLFFYSLD